MDNQSHSHDCPACGNGFEHNSANCIAGKVTSCEKCFIYHKRQAEFYLGQVAFAEIMLDLTSPVM